MFCLKLFKIYLNVFLKIIIIGIYNYILIKPVYIVLIKEIMIYYLKIYGIGKEDF